MASEETLLLAQYSNPILSCTHFLTFVAVDQ